MSDVKEAIVEAQTGVLTHGTQLCERAEKDGGFAEYFQGNLALDEKRYPDAKARMAMTAVVMENVKKWYMGLDETTRALQVGGYIDHLFPLIRASFTNNPIMDLVSVQPMTKKVGLIFYMNYIVGQTKGTYAKGQRIFDVFTGFQGGQDYSSEKVDQEQIGTTASAATSATANMTYIPVRPGTVVVSFGSDNLVLRDDGNGNLVFASGSLTSATGTINYQTGAVTLASGGGNFAATEAIYSAYEYDSEISGVQPQVDIQLSSVAIQAISRALRIRYSQDAAFDFRTEFGVDADATLTQGVAELIRTEQAREVIADLWNAAGPAFTTFPLSSYAYQTGAGGATGFSKLEFFKDIVYYIESTSDSIYQATQRLHANWLVCDTLAGTIIKSLPSTMFESAGIDNTTSGVQFLGTLMGRYRVWVDKLLNTYPGAAAGGNILMGYKGADWIDAGYVWAPYQPLYTTAAVTLDDMLTRKAMRMRYAKKLINPRIYRKIAIG